MILFFFVCQLSHSERSSAYEDGRICGGLLDGLPAVGRDFLAAYVICDRALCGIVRRGAGICGVEANPLESGFVRACLPNALLQLSPFFPVVS
jgi:hypothetical protein